MKLLVAILEHILYAGATRRGKSERFFATIAPRMLAKDRPSFWVFDSARELVWKIALYLAIHEVDFLFDALRNTTHGLGLPFCLPSTHPDPEQAEAENRETMRDTISVLVRGEGKIDTSQNPMLDRALADAVTLLLCQRTPASPDKLEDCFVADSDNARYLMQNCDRRTKRGRKVYRRFLFYHRLFGQQREYNVGAAERRINKVCECPQYRKRCAATIDPVAFINGGGIALFDGSSKGNLNREDSALLMGMTILMLISLARSGQLKRRLVIGIDEARTSGLIDLNVARALAEAGKWNIEFHLITQNMLTMPPEIQESILGNCTRLYLFKQPNPRAARFFAEIAAIKNFDAMRVKEVIRRLRQEHLGVDVQEIEHTSVQYDDEGKRKGSGKSTSHVSTPIYGTREEETIVRYTPEEQILEWMQRLLCYGVGQCAVIEEDVAVDLGRVPMLPFPARANWPWQRKPLITLAERKLACHLAAQKTRPAFQFKTQETTWKRRTVME